MDKCIKIIVTLTIVSQLVLARSYGGFNRHSDFHHSFEHPDPQLWHHGMSTWESPGGWRPSMRGIYHGHYRGQFPRGSDHLDKEYWHAHHPVSYERRQDWYHDTSGGVYDRYPMWQMWQWQHNMPPSWNMPQGNRLTTTTTVSTPVNSQQQIQTCIRSCPTTPEYNPVCGSNNVTYTNPGRLECARYCGVDVVLQRRASCSVQTTQAPFTTTPWITTVTTTIPPITPPPFRPTNQPDQSLYPDIDLSIFTSNTEPSTISPDVLASVFPKPDDSDADVDIDIRTRGGPGQGYVDK